MDKVSDLPSSNKVGKAPSINTCHCAAHPEIKPAVRDLHISTSFYLTHITSIRRTEETLSQPQLNGMGMPHSDTPHMGTVHSWCVWYPELRSITPVATQVHVMLRSLVVLTWMRDTIESMYHVTLWNNTKDPHISISFYLTHSQHSKKRRDPLSVTTQRNGNATHPIWVQSTLDVCDILNSVVSHMWQPKRTWCYGVW